MRNNLVKAARLSPPQESSATGAGKATAKLGEGVEERRAGVARKGEGGAVSLIELSVVHSSYRGSAISGLIAAITVEPGVGGLFRDPLMGSLNRCRYRCAAVLLRPPRPSPVV